MTDILNSINWFAIISSTVQWIGWILLAAIIGIVVFAVFYWFSFPIKITVLPLFGSGKDGVFSFGKAKHNRVRYTKGRINWATMFPLMNKDKIKPFDTEYIYPGKQCYAFSHNGVLIPARININKSEKSIRAELNIVPYEYRNWQSLTHKKNALEFAEEGWWEQNKGFVYMLIAVAICCILCGVTVWLTYQFADVGRAGIGGLTQAINNINTIPGK